MAKIDELLRAAYEMRDGFKSLRKKIGKVKARLGQGDGLVQIVRDFAGDHLDDMSDARTKIAAARLQAIRVGLCGPRPAYKIITEAEYVKMVELAREVLHCDDPDKAMKLCGQAMSFSIEVIEAHDTFDVLADVEPIVEIAIDAHEQAIAWYEQNDLRITFTEWKERQRKGLPNLLAEYAAKSPVHVEGVPSVTTTAAPSPGVTVSEGPRPGEAAPTVDTSNPTADPT